jgi:Tol biopolymer transport system component
LAWTPDGKEIIFDSSPAGKPRLWRVATSGGSPEPLDAYGIRPTISRQGKQLAYQANLFANVDIWRIDLPAAKNKGAAPKKLIASSRWDGQAQISPDNTKIAFVSERSGSAEIWRCDSSGLNPLQLTHSGGSLTGTPRWSPDSKYIAYDSRPEKHSDIFIISAEGGALRRLTTDPSDDSVPSWSRNGRWIYFTSNRTGKFQIWKMPVQGGNAVQVTKGGGDTAFESLNGEWVYFIKGEGAGSIWKTSVAGGEEYSVLDVFTYWAKWALVADGIYYPDNSVEPVPVKFFRFATGRATTVAVPPKVFQDLAVSLDQRWFIYSQVESIEGDIALVENFR